jgi:HEPN domain-containing protein
MDEKPVGLESDAQAWFNWSEMSYFSAQTLFGDGNPFLWFGAACLGHQAIEMYLKTILIGRGRRAVKGDAWGHSLFVLLRQVCDTGIIVPEHLVEDCNKFDAFFEELRYPARLNKVDGLGQEEQLRLKRVVDVLKPWAEEAARNSCRTPRFGAE